jgi:hypothetical protein
MSERQVFQTKEAAVMLNTSAQGLYQRLYKRQVTPPSFRFGHSYLWTKADIERAREQLRQIREGNRAKEELCV